MDGKRLIVRAGEYRIFLEAAGLAVSILLLLWVNDELSFDRFNQHAASLYQLSPTFENASGENVWGTTPGPIGPYAKKEVPEVEAFCRLNEKWDITYFMYRGRKVVQWNNQQVDPSFFSMFSYPLIEGDPRHPFKDAQSIVISESTAKRIFGNKDPMGKVLKEPGILGVTESGRDIVNTSSGTSSVDWDGKRADQHSYTITQLPVETNFLDVMGIKLVEGKGFTGGPADSTNFILNETAIKEAGISEPVVGKRFTLHRRQGVIAGVVKDFHYEDMHKKIRPIIIYYSTDWRWKIFVETTGKDAPRALAAVRRVWARYNPDYDLLYTFLDTEFDELYKTDTHVGVLFNCFAVLAICIPCLGLFGLVTFTAESKLKEIGVRKVLGAGVAQIVGLQARDFLWLVVVAAAVAIPVAWYGLSGFLASLVLLRW